MNQVPQLPTRVCPRHGLVAGRDGRCVICHRDRAKSDDPQGSRQIVGLVLAAVALFGGVLVWKGFRGARVTAPTVVTADPGAPAPPPAVADRDEGPGPLLPDEARAASRVASEASRQRDIEAAMTRVPVRMFTVAKCEMCDAARAYLKEKGLRFTETDVGSDPSALEAMHKLTPSSQVPVFDVDGEVLVGFGPTNVIGAVRRAAEKRNARP